MTGVAVRGDVAMTGEITLRGKVLPIGGLKEKVLAAYRYGTKTLVVPRENERDLSEIPDDIRKALTFHLVDNMDEVLEIALVGPYQGRRWGTGRREQPGRRTGSHWLAVAVPAAARLVRVCTSKWLEDRRLPIRSRDRTSGGRAASSRGRRHVREVNVGKSTLINGLLR
jgi:hypothetical protein